LGGGQGGQEGCGKKADEGGAEEQEEEYQTLTLALMIA